MGRIPRQLDGYAGHIDVARDLAGGLKPAQRSADFTKEIGEEIHQAAPPCASRCCSSSANRSVMPAM